MADEFDEHAGNVPIASKLHDQTKPRLIVPLAEERAFGFGGFDVAHPEVSYHGGHLLTSVEVIPIYWGAAWATDENSVLADELDRFFDFITGSSLMESLAEYGVSYGRRDASFRITDSEPAAQLTAGFLKDATLQNTLSNWISNGRVKKPSANTLYFVYLPPGVPSQSPDGKSSRSDFCGYHHYVNNIYYALVPYIDRGGCIVDGHPFIDTLTLVSSHELCEGVTNPSGAGWWDDRTGDADARNEIADICNRLGYRVGRYLVQREWSNHERVCVPRHYWQPEQINLGGRTQGSKAAGDPFPCAFANQFHILYRDSDGVVWDSYYADTWKLERINSAGGRSGLTKGNPAAGDPRACQFWKQFHVVYRDQEGVVWDAYYADAWRLEQINTVHSNQHGLTAGRAAASEPFPCVFSDQFHILYRDSEGIVWDSYYAGGTWRLERINTISSKQRGLTTGPAAVGDPFPCVFSGQFHVLYRDGEGIVWDSYYAGGAWRLEQINTISSKQRGLTSGPAAVGDPFPCVFYNQFHVLYRDSEGIVWDSYYASGTWRKEQINSIDGKRGLTSGGMAASDPRGFGYWNQFHVVYRDDRQNVCDCYYAGQWRLDQINNGGLTTTPPAAGPPAITGYYYQLHVVYRDAAGTVWDPYYG